MKKLNRLTAIIFLISFILPILAHQLKTPEFLDPLEIRIAQFQEPSKIEIGEKKSYNELILDDPFKLTDRGKRTPQGDLAKRQLETPYVSLIYQGKKKYVILGDSLAKEGERVGDFRVIKILNDRVLIRDKKGEKTWLKLENY